MKDIFKLLLILFFEFVKSVGLWAFGGLFVFIVFELCRFAFGYTAEFHFLRTFFILGGLSLILFIAHKLSAWQSKNGERIELREWR